MESHLADVWFALTDLEVVSGSGSTITTTDGTDYLDLTSGIGVVNTGHCHPAVVEAVHVMAIALRRLGDFGEAQELCQDVFIQAMKKIRQLREPEAFAGWLRSITGRYAPRSTSPRSPATGA
jgi:4-aminobutyrate aminotransferase-like enzyme